MSDFVETMLPDAPAVEEEQVVEEQALGPLEKVLSNFMASSPDGRGLSRGAADLVLGMDEKTPVRSRDLMNSMLNSIYEQGGTVTVEQLEEMAWDAGIPGAATIPSRGENLPTLVREALTSALVLEGYSEDDIMTSMDEIVELAIGGGN